VRQIENFRTGLRGGHPSDVFGQQMRPIVTAILAIPSKFCAGFSCYHKHSMIRKLKSGRYRLYSRKPDPRTGKRRNLGTFDTRAAAEKHERAVQYFKRR